MTMNAEQMEAELKWALEFFSPPETGYTTRLIQLLEAMRDEIGRQRSLLSACDPYLKEDETPSQRIERERADSSALCKMLAAERKKAEALEAENAELKEIVLLVDASVKKAAELRAARKETKQYDGSALHQQLQEANNRFHQQIEAADIARRGAP